jgi:hypothetical protein
VHHPAEASFEQLQASVLVVDKNLGNQASVAIYCVRPEFDISTEHQLAHGLFASLTERLGLLWRINKSESDGATSLVSIGRVPAKSSLADTYWFTSGPHRRLAVARSAWLPLPSLCKARRLTSSLNGCEESPGLITVLKGTQPEGRLMKFFAFDRYPTQARATFAWHGSAE